MGLTHLIAHNPLRLLIIEHRHRKPALVFRVLCKVDIAKVRIVRMQWVRGDIFTRQFLVGGYKAPAFTMLETCIIDRTYREEVTVPFSPRCQCTEVNEMKSSRPLSFRVIKVRCAVSGHINNCPFQTVVMQKDNTHPMDTHTKHRDDTCPSPEETPNQIPSR